MQSEVGVSNFATVVNREFMNIVYWPIFILIGGLIQAAIVLDADTLQKVALQTSPWRPTKTPTPPRHMFETRRCLIVGLGEDYALKF